MIACTCLEATFFVWHQKYINDILNKKVYMNWHNLD